MTFAKQAQKELQNIRKIKIHGKIKDIKKTHETIVPVDGRTENGNRWQGRQTHSSEHEDHALEKEARVKGTTVDGQKQQQGKRGAVTRRDVLYTHQRVRSTHRRVLAG
jgi:hypothetical protein